MSVAAIRPRAEHVLLFRFYSGVSRNGQGSEPLPRKPDGGSQYSNSSGGGSFFTKYSSCALKFSGVVLATAAYF